MELIRTTVRLPEDVFKSAKVRAIEEDKSLQDLITDAIRQYLKKGGRK